MKKIILILFLIAMLSLSGCYQSVVDSLSEYTVQVPVTVNMVNSGDTKRSYTPDNLNNYEEYRENKNRVNRISLYQVSYHTVSVLPADAIDIHFDRMTFYFETGGKQYKIGEIEDVTLQDFYRKPYIDEIDDEMMDEISRSLLNDPNFATISIYETDATEGYDEVLSTLVVAVRIEVDLLEGDDE